MSKVDQRARVQANVSEWARLGILKHILARVELSGLDGLDEIAQDARACVGLTAKHLHLVCE